LVNESIINTIREYLSELKNNGIFIEKTFLFGSCAKGTSTDQSDIDIMIVSPLFDDEETRDRLIGKVWHATKVSDFKIEPHAVGLQRFAEDDYSPIIALVKEEGIEIN